MNSRPKIIIHVFRGSDANMQYVAWLAAIANIEKRHGQSVELKIVYMSTSSLRNSHWTPMEFINWLQSCHYHFILGHAHQGIPLWNGFDLLRAYAALRDSKHPGYPSGDCLNCPIFTQDKNKYLEGTSYLV